MNELLKSTYRISIIESAFFIAIGALLFLNPGGFVEIVSYLIGAFALTYGIINIVKYLRNKEMGMAKFFLTLGIILSVIGLFLILNPTFIGAIIPTVIGVCLIINGIEKLMYLKYLQEKGSEGYMIALISGIVVLVVGIYLLFNPFASTLIVTQIIGVIIIVYSVMDLIEKMRFRGFVKGTQKQIDKAVKIVDEK